MTTKVSPDLLKKPFRKNALINGDMTIWQRGTTFTAIANGAYTADRWIYAKSGAAVHDLSRSTDVPTVAEAGQLFTSSVLMDCTTVDSSIAAGDYVVFIQRIEGYYFRPLAQKQMTFSFWVKATKTGTYCVAFRNGGANRSYVAEYTINTTATWEKKTIVVPASPSAGTWDYTNGIGLDVIFALACGSTFQTTAGSWATGDFMGSANQVNGVDSTSNDFRLTGVQLESGDLATEFEYRHINDELQMCQRYFAPIKRFNGTSGSTTNQSFANIHYPVPMRAAPTLGVTGTLNITEPGVAGYTQSTGQISVAGHSTEYGAFVSMANYSGLTTHRFHMLNGVTNYITADAEL